MEFPTARVGFRFGAGAHGGKPFRVTYYTVGIMDTELHFITRVRIQVQYTAGKHVGRDNVESGLTVDALAIQSQHG